jgi:hypothetical protein
MSEEDAYLISQSSINQLREDHELLRSMVSSSIGRRFIKRDPQPFNRKVIFAVITKAMIPGSILNPSQFSASRLISLHNALVGRGEGRSAMSLQSSGSQSTEPDIIAWNHSNTLSAGIGASVVLAVTVANGKSDHYVPIWVEERCVFN